MPVAQKAVQPTQTFLGRMWQSIETVFTHDAWPFLQNLFHTIQLDEVKSLMPIVEDAVTELEAELTALLAGGGTEDVLKALNTLVAGTWEKAQAAGKNVSMTDLVTAAHAGLVNLHKKLGG